MSSDKVQTIRNRAGTLLVVAEEMDDGLLCVFPNGQSRELKAQQLDSGSEEELALSDPAISDPQRRTMEVLARHAASGQTMAELDAWVRRHDPELEGGAFLADVEGKTLEIDVLVARLGEWLRSSREATLGGGVGVRDFLFLSMDGLRIGVHADVPASGVAEFLKFVARAGGPEAVQVERSQLAEPGSVSFKFAGAAPECPRGFYTTRPGS